MADLHLIGGEKGGPGKSMVCRTLTQYHLDRDYTFTLYDTDRSNPDLMRIYGKSAGCQLGVFSEGEQYEDTANAIFNSAIAARTLCNLPAQVFIPLKDWIEKNDLLSLAHESGICFYLWHVSDCGSDSLKLFRRSLKHFGTAMPHIFVKNYGMTDNWEPFDSDERLQALIAAHDVTIMSFPKFIGNKDRNIIDNLSLTFGDARAYEGFGPISRQRVKTFLRKAYAAFDGVPALCQSPSSSHKGR
ncbi:MAG: hypothetical protein AAFR99_15600 [Cyanobacteria bacterium J06629_9]